MKRIVLNRYTLVLVIILFLFNCKTAELIYKSTSHLWCKILT